MYRTLIRFTHASRVRSFTSNRLDRVALRATSWLEGTYPALGPFRTIGTLIVGARDRGLRDGVRLVKSAGADAQVAGDDAGVQQVQGEPGASGAGRGGERGEGTVT